MPATTGDTARLRGYWDKHAPNYDRQMRFFDRVLFGDTRTWVCQQATGDVLEVAIGTGLNLGSYPDDIRLTGVDFSPAMLERARDRARELGRPVDLREGDAHALAFPDGSFDTVVCTFSLCAIPGHAGPSPRWAGCCARAGCCCWPTTSPARRGRSGRSSGCWSWSPSRLAASTSDAARSSRYAPKDSSSSARTGSSWGSSSGWRPASRPPPTGDPGDGRSR